MADPISPASEDLQYFISEKDSFLVVSFVGPISRETIPVLEKCKAEIAQSAAKKIVINFRDVTDVGLHGIGPLIQLQKVCRDKGGYRICSVRPDLKKFLDEKGAIRGDELVPNLREALLALK